MKSYSSAAMSNPTIRVVSILSLLTAESPGKVGLVEICERLGIAKSTGALVLAELCASGYLIQEHGTLRYGVGMKACMPPVDVTDSYIHLVRSRPFLENLHSIMGVPISIVNLSRRSSIVTQTIDPVSTLARLGFRRPHLAPFGTCFLIGASEGEKSTWIEHALQMEGSGHDQLRRSMKERIDRVVDQGYEVVYQCEQDVLENAEIRLGRWVGDLFEDDTRMNSYRREVLRASLNKEVRDDHSGSIVPVSRIIIPIQSGVDAESMCMELWPGGKELGSDEIQSIVEKARSTISNFVGC